MKYLLLIIAFAFAANIGYSQCAAGINQSFFGDSLFEATSSSSGFAPGQTLFQWIVYDNLNNVIYTDSTYDTTSGYSEAISNLIGIDPLTVCLVIFDSTTNCIDSLCVSATMPCPSNLSLASTMTDPTCAGACDGSVNITSIVNAYSGIAAVSWAGSVFSSTNPSTVCAGTYYVTVTDSFGCAASDSFLFADPALLSTNILAFGSICDSAGMLLSSSTTGGPTPYTYSWNQGSTTPGISVNSSGIYVVTVTNANGCNATDSIIVAPVNAISTSNSSTNETCASCCDGTASVTASGGSGAGFTYFWSTGDTATSISGLCAGGYSVIVTDTNGCTQIDSVFIVTQSGCANSISGSIIPISETTIYLIEEAFGVLSLLDSVNIDSGNYTFNNLCAGTYFVKAALRPSSSQFSFYLPTYHVQSALWGNATAVVSNGAISGVDINMLVGANLGGPGFIGGLISQGANRAEGDPIVGADVVLMNQNDEVLTSVKTDAAGAYSFAGVPVGDYKILVDLINFDPFPHLVSITAEDASFSNKNFIVEGGIIRPEITIGIESMIEAASFEVYPNPASDHLIIEGENIASVQVFNLLGEQISTETGFSSSRIELSLSNLVAGQYIVKIKAQTGHIFHTNIVKQ